MTVMRPSACQGQNATGRLRNCLGSRVGERGNTRSDGREEAVMCNYG